MEGGWFPIEETENYTDFATAKLHSRSTKGSITRFLRPVRFFGRNRPRRCDRVIKMSETTCCEKCGGTKVSAKRR